MGLVFEAHHKFTRRSVAVKLLPDDLLLQNEAKERLLREAHALTTVRHPGFVEVLDAGVCDDHGPYVVLEMLEGRTLEGILAARRRLTESRTRCSSADSSATQSATPTRAASFIATSSRATSSSRGTKSGWKRSENHQSRRCRPRGRAPGSAQSEAHDGPCRHRHAGVHGPRAALRPRGRRANGRVRNRHDALRMSDGRGALRGSYPEVLVRVSNATDPAPVRVKRADVPAALAVVIENALEKESGARFQTATELGRALVASSGFAPRWSSLLSAPDEAASPPVQKRRSPERAIKLVRKKSARGGGGAAGRAGPGPGQGPCALASQAVRAGTLCHSCADRFPRREADRRAQRGNERRGDARRFARFLWARRFAAAALRVPDDGRDDSHLGKRSLDARGPRTDGNGPGVHRRAPGGARSRRSLHCDPSQSAGMRLVPSGARALYAFASHTMTLPSDASGVRVYLLRARRLRADRCGHRPFDASFSRLHRARAGKSLRRSVCERGPPLHAQGLLARVQPGARSSRRKGRGQRRRVRSEVDAPMRRPGVGRVRCKDRRARRRRTTPASAPSERRDVRRVNRAPALRIMYLECYSIRYQI